MLTGEIGLLAPAEKRRLVPRQDLEHHDVPAQSEIRDRHAAMELGEQKTVAAKFPGYFVVPNSVERRIGYAVDDDCHAAGRVPAGQSTAQPRIISTLRLNKDRAGMPHRVQP